MSAYLDEWQRRGPFLRAMVPLYAPDEQLRRLRDDIAERFTAVLATAVNAERGPRGRRSARPRAPPPRHAASIGAIMLRPSGVSAYRDAPASTLRETSPSRSSPRSDPVSTFAVTPRSGIRRFVETDGRARPGTDDLLLTTRGRRSGVLRRTALVYVRDGARYVVTASNRGADTHPAWYLNLVADPAVTVRVGAETFAARARTATPAEKPPPWVRMVAAMPSYRGYQESTRRDIPVVIIERTA